jgi:predicted DNA-binding transcriptional regulator AlpA
MPHNRARLNDEPATTTSPVPRHHHIDRRAAEIAEYGAAAGDADELLSTSEVAEWLGLSTQWLEIGRHRGYGPKWIQLSPRRTRYLRSDVLAWLRSRTYARTSEYA